MKIYRVIISFTLIIFLFSCSVDKEKPNVILIMADNNLFLGISVASKVKLLLIPYFKSIPVVHGSYFHLPNSFDLS